MTAHTESKGYLILDPSDGSAPVEFSGRLFGAALTKESHTSDRGFGEVVFNTSMTGYQEILTDPSYYGQMVCMTVPHVGNTGVNEEGEERRRSWRAGLVF